MTDRYAAVGVRLDAADDAKRRNRRAGADDAHGAPRSARSARSAAWCGCRPGTSTRPWSSRPTGSAPKVLVAARAGIHDTVGEDLVNHCVKRHSGARRPPPGIPRLPRHG